MSPRSSTPGLGEIRDFRIASRVFTDGDRRTVRELGGDPLDHGEGRIGARMQAENYVVALFVILIVERGEILVQVRFQPGDRLEDRDGGEKLRGKLEGPACKRGEAKYRERKIQRPCERNGE